MAATQQSHLASTPKPPYFAVIFTNILHAPSPSYSLLATRMSTLAAQQPGYLGQESTRNAETLLGITVSYWTDEESVRKWKGVAEHLAAQEVGRKEFYSVYKVRVAEVKRDYGWGSEV
ncbi:uncharacterized protein EV422DRAFT_534050 [Fimicolochytrium jonesii]|uniref:uncharacterized protein n=1 Tax=Fimicolochytrium jonesii TaxID=1396493 RepID=UPI0022FE3F21|nr:uncharacterized protein EV422DRAFT_534050 [Fimicolochytrium jonesii]KAI8819718.1 hypothetical protein EV422DRAFT_534050 [Fimicolochytrium jonesii]